jgi:hypothetical protein
MEFAWTYTELDRKIAEVAPMLIKGTKKLLQM